MKKSLLTTALLLAVLALPSASLAVQENECIKPCTSTPIKNTFGTKPAGISFTLTWDTLTHGTGTAQCNTCTECKVATSLSFNSHGSNWRMSYDVHTGMGWAGPHSLYARDGQLVSICNDPTPGMVTAMIHDAGVEANQGVYAEEIVATCPCD